MWRTPETLVEIGFSRSRVVMINEFHNGLLRCPWMREVGRRIAPGGIATGCRPGFPLGPIVVLCRFGRVPLDTFADLGRWNTSGVPYFPRSRNAGSRPAGYPF